MPEQISVLVVDDEPVIRTGLSVILDSQADITVAGTANNGEEAVEVCARLRLDVLVMDIRMPHRDGLWALGELGRRPSAWAGVRPGAHADHVRPGCLRRRCAVGRGFRLPVDEQFV